MQQQKKSSLVSLTIFLLRYFLIGTSDPYVKFKVAGKEVFRSKTIHKNLNPVWDERASLLVETLRDPLYVKVSTNPHKWRQMNFENKVEDRVAIYNMVSTGAALCNCRFLTTTLDFRMISWARRTFIWSRWNIKGCFFHLSYQNFIS